MTPDLLLALALFAFVGSISPGPSNFMLLASGANFGFRRTIPQVLGITAGLSSVMIAVGLGLGALLTALPILGLALKIAGGTYLLYLAWRIAMARSMGRESEAGERPLTVLQSASFQWINPKAWVAATSIMAIYTNAADPLWSVATITATVALVNVPSVAVWAAFGMALKGFLADPTRLKYFNIAMGLLLAATLWPLVK